MKVLVSLYYSTRVNYNETDIELKLWTEVSYPDIKPVRLERILLYFEQ